MYKKIILIFFMSLYGFNLGGMDAPQSPKESTALASSSSSLPLSSSSLSATKPLQTSTPDVYRSPSGLASPPSFTRAMLDKQIIALKKDTDHLYTNQRKVQLLEEFLALSDEKSQVHLLQIALSLRNAEKGYKGTYDRDCFKKVEFFASQSEMFQVANYWATGDINVLKSMSNLGPYEGIGMTLRDLADHKQWTRDHMIEQLKLLWELRYKLENIHQEQEKKIKSTDLAGGSASVTTPPETPRSRPHSRRNSLSLFKRGGSGNNSPDRVHHH